MSKCVDILERELHFSKIRKEKGITLVALIVTIIVLLILAGISIASLTGSGLFEKVKLSKEKQENAQIEENTILRDYENNLNQYLISSNRNDETYDKNIYDFWLTWLSLGGVDNPKQYNGQKILSNEALMEKVMNNEDAIEYMLNSQEFIFPKVLDSQVASSKLYSSSKMITVPKLETNINSIIYSGFFEDYTDQWGTYKLYHVFDRNSSTFAASTKAGTQSIGSYIGYDFGRPVNVLKVDGKIRMYSYKIQYSDNKEEWTDCIENTSAGNTEGNEFSDLITENVGKHRYWRLYVNGGQYSSSYGTLVWELQFYGF